MQKKVRESMTEEVVTINESTTPEEALDIAYENKVERLPVVKNNRIVGIVTIRDILECKKYPNAFRDKDGRFLVAAATGPFDLGTGHRTWTRQGQILLPLMWPMPINQALLTLPRT